jgi:hypothetical protein
VIVGALPVLGFGGAGLLVVSWFATLAGILGPITPAAGLLALPIALWEFSLAIYLVARGFRPSPITARMQGEPGWNRARERDDGGVPVKITIFGIKLVHTIIFWILSGCTVYSLFSGVTGRITTWTWVAVVLLLVESVVLAVSGWTCPLTILAERQGAQRGSVTDIFLPKWLADRIFPICGSMYVIALALILWRVLR